MLLLLASVLHARALSYPDGPQAGDPAPPLRITGWLQAPAVAADGWPVGKVVVLEFWGTTCTPCVEEIPHLNDLVEKFKSKPVQFVAATEDSQEVIERFLKKTPVKGWIGLCPGGIFGETNAYRVAAIPHTVIINPHGRIDAVLDPRELTPAIINASLSGKAPSPQHQMLYPGEVPGQRQAGINPMFQVLIQPSPQTWMPRGMSGFVARDSGAVSLQSDELARAISQVYDVRPILVISETEMPKDRYDFFVSMPKSPAKEDGRQKLEAAFSLAVEGSFGLSLKREARELNVLVLRTNAATVGKLLLSSQALGRRPDKLEPGELSLSDRPLSALCQELEVSAQQPVLDETGLTNHYNFALKWYQQNFRDINIPGLTAAVNSLGLDLISEKRPLDVVVVRKAP